MKTERLVAYCPPKQTAGNFWEVLLHTEGKHFPTDGDPLPYDSDMVALVYGSTEADASETASRIAAAWRGLELLREAREGLQFNPAYRALVARIDEVIK